MLLSPGCHGLLQTHFGLRFLSSQDAFVLLLAGKLQDAMGSSRRLGLRSLVPRMPSGSYSVQDASELL